MFGHLYTFIYGLYLHENIDQLKVGADLHGSILVSTEIPRHSTKYPVVARLQLPSALGKKQDVEMVRIKLSKYGSNQAATCIFGCMFETSASSHEFKWVAEYRHPIPFTTRIPNMQTTGPQTISWNPPSCKILIEYNYPSPRTQSSPPGLSFFWDRESQPRPSLKQRLLITDSRDNPIYLHQSCWQ